MKVGLFFGSFNPVHTGHLIIASFVANNSNLDQVWFVISPQNPLKPQAALLNEYHRKHLVDIAIDGERKLRSSAVEFSLPKPSYTIDTLAYLEEKNPEHSFTVIMGSDSYTNLNKWKNYELILKNYKIIIYRRPGFEVSDLPKNVTLLDAPLLQISSTHIREMVKKKQSIRYLVPDVVKEEIERSSYYK